MREMRDETVAWASVLRERAVHSFLLSSHTHTHTHAHAAKAGKKGKEHESFIPTDERASEGLMGDRGEKGGKQKER
jgi:hypothetical protein